VTVPATAPVAAFYGTVPSPCVDAGAPLAEACGGINGTKIYYRYSPATTVLFTNVSQNTTGATYAWDFGDPASGANNTSTAQSPGHTYATPGAFTVALTVTTAGGTSTSTRDQYVNLGCIVPSLIGRQTGNGANNVTSSWTGANFQASNLFFWHTGGSYTNSEPSGQSKYTVQQQNPQGLAFFVATPSGSSYSCATQGRVAPAGAVPAP
jgi:PKD repeat protein